jgi:hypothetical protein
MEYGRWVAGITPKSRTLGRIEMCDIGFQFETIVLVITVVAGDF